MQSSSNASDNVWRKVGVIVACIATFIVTATFKGGWIFNVLEPIKLKSYLFGNTFTSANNTRPFLERWLLQDLSFYITMATIVSFIFYYGVGAFFHYAFYVKRREKPEEWKIQPDRFLTPSLLRHEILLGSLNLVIGSIASGTLTCYTVNGGKTMMYFDPYEYGVPYLIFSIPCYFLMVDALVYYSHAMLHLPFLYKNIHKYHHQYYSPTTFGAIAVHPLEFMSLYASAFLPLFLIPTHVAIGITVNLYNFYYGMVGHSGVMYNSIWPWQADSKFHDDHHKYFHVNFGINTRIFDWLHDSLRREDREYGEDIFYGKGRPKKVLGKED